MASGGAFDLTNELDFSFDGLDAFNYGLGTFDAIQGGVENELFAASIADALGLPPVTARDVVNAQPGGVIDRFLTSRGFPLSAPMFDAAACNADPVCAAAIANAINANPVARAQVEAAIDADPALKAVVSAQINANPILQAQVAQQLALEAATASPVGGIGMSVPFLDFNIQPSFTGSPMGPTQPESFFGSDSILGSIANAIPSVLTGLARAGVIRGSVGQALNPMVPSAVGMTPAGFVASASLPAILGGLGALQLPSAGTILNTMNVGATALNMLGGLGGLFGGGGGRCGAAQPAVQAPSLFRMTACGGMRLPARQQVIGPDGGLYIIQSLGRATRGSREQSAMRRLARDNGFTVTRRGGGRARRYRRPR